jgi:S-adenosylmethionine:tRNA ribosyltransferase-isomerase
MRLEDFDYLLPARAIAQAPAEPRDAARMLVAGDPIVDTWVSRLPEFVRPGDLLVVNATRVRAARLVGRRPTGGRVELLVLRPEADAWIALARPARKLRAGMNLSFDGFEAEVLAVEGEGTVRISLPAADRASAEALIDGVGRVPYPPYVTTGPPDPERYQTVYARNVGSAAAPTAGLHFTAGLLDALAAAGVARAEVSLDIGLDTFRPITSPDIDDHEMHTEEYTIPEHTVAAVDRARAHGGRVIAVGTTVVRALESAALEDGSIQPGLAATGLFIRPGYRPQVVDALLTNFHLPRSSLVVMIAALVPQWRDLYEHALAAGYRFLSFGDAMFVPDVR